VRQKIIVKEKKGERNPEYARSFPQEPPEKEYGQVKQVGEHTSKFAIFMGGIPNISAHNYHHQE